MSAVAANKISDYVEHNKKAKSFTKDQEIIKIVEKFDKQHLAFFVEFSFVILIALSFMPKCFFATS